MLQSLESPNYTLNRRIPGPLLAISGHKAAVAGHSAPNPTQRLCGFRLRLLA